MTFQIKSYALSRDVVSIQKKQQTYDKQFRTSPLVVLNNFSGEGLHLKLMASMFQNMFPAINVNTVRLNAIRRCVLFNYHPEDGTIEFRHYSIRLQPVNVSRGVKKLLQSKVPDLSKLNDISDLMVKDEVLSESEFEDNEGANQITLPQKLSIRGNKQPGMKSAIRLVELGPRMTLSLLKIEENLLDGEVLYHQYIEKTEKEKKLIKRRRLERAKQKEKARKEQEANIKKKEEEKEQMKEKCLEGAKKKHSLVAAVKRKFKDELKELGGDKPDDDVAYFEQEVGHAPDSDLFSKPIRRDSKTTDKKKEKGDKKVSFAVGGKKGGKKPLSRKNK
uniref:EOG090X0508 n=1 Tax=Lynceus sp. MCZ IZ 141354 TaxID=1930659 RepID=A0A9N6WYF0_9CRUS|nr:EOG090X0508 [Lynceus sp. MCZ IZ 141354]